MKSRWIPLCLLAAGLLAGCGGGSTPTPPTKQPDAVAPADAAHTADEAAAKGETKPVVQNLVDLATAGNCKDMARLLHDEAATGGAKRGLDYADPNQRLAAEKLCAKLQALVDGVEDMEYKEFVAEQGTDGAKRYLWQLNFVYDDGIEEVHALHLLRGDSTYLLHDVR